MKKSYIIMLIVFSAFCGRSPLQKSEDTENLKVLFFSASPSQTGVSIMLMCSVPAQGHLSYGNRGTENQLFNPYKMKIHFFQVSGLNADTDYSYQTACLNGRKSTSYIQKFRTASAPPVTEPNPPYSARQKGIWILGGVGYGGTAVSEVDLFDPDNGKYYSAVTSIPTPRSFAGITVLKDKFYVIGGISTSGVSSAVEEFDPMTLTWKTLSNSPVSLQGSLALPSGDSIYMIGGAVTVSVSSAIPNVVYKLTPGLGSSGTWSTVTSGSTVPARTDLSGCSADGNLFFNSGRFTDGSAQLTSDSYLPASNSTSSISESNFTLARFGAGSGCYLPKISDTYSSDPGYMFVVGGSTLSNTSQPASAILPTNRFDYYPVPATVNTVSSGQNLPVSVYAPAVGFSYTQRLMYVFGGATMVNNPTADVYAINPSNPAGSSWTAALSMPRARFGHSALSMGR